MKLLRNVSVDEISLVRKGANGKRIYLKKSMEQDQAILEKAMADKAKAEADAAASAQALEKALAEKATAEAAAQALEKALADKVEAAEIAESISKAAVDFPNLPEKAEVVGPVLRSIRKSDPKAADVVDALLRKLDAVSKQLLEPRGRTDASDASATALDEITKRAQGLVAEGKAKTLAKAFDQVLSADKDLYNRYVTEQKAR